MNSIEKTLTVEEKYGAIPLSKYDNQVAPIEKNKLAIFDFDETLVHSKDVFRQVNIETMKYYNLKITEEIINTIFAIYDKKYIGWGRNLEEQADIYRTKFSPMVSELSADPRFYRQMKLYNGMREVILELSKTDIALAIASSRDLTSILRFLQEEDIKHHFSMIEATEGGKIFPDKPKPHVANWIMSETGIDSKNAVMIGDSACDIELGKNAGMKTIAIGYGKYTSPEKLLDKNPDVMLTKEEEISSLPKIITGLLSKSR